MSVSAFIPAPVGPTVGSRQVSPMNSLKLVGAVFALIATVLLLLVQFLPWAGTSRSGSGFSSSADAYTWNVHGSSGFANFHNSGTSSWYSSDEKDADGIHNIQAGIPMLLAGLVIVGLGALLAFLVKGPAGPVVVLVGALVFAAGLIFFAMGLDAFFSSDQSWEASFYLAIVGGALALVGGVLGLVAGNAPGRGSGSGGSY